MKPGVMHFCSCLLVTAALAASPLSQSQANARPPLAGSYRAIQQTAVGGQTNVRLQIHLLNHGPKLVVRRITLWDFSHPVAGATQPCSIVLGAGNFADTTQSFVIPHAQYGLWQHGTRPRLVLEVVSADGRRSTRIVRLDRMAGGKAAR